jgi:outer membrane protein
MAVSQLVLPRLYANYTFRIVPVLTRTLRGSADITYKHGDKMRHWIFGAAAIAEVVATCAMPGLAQADELDNVIRVGYADISPRGSSTDLMGPPGTTPPGIGMKVKNLQAFALSYERRLSPYWALQFQGGVPPIVTAEGAGAGSAVGEAAKARIWFPSVLAIYTFADVPLVHPYVGVGMTYTFFTEEKASPDYTAAFQGSSSSAKLGSSWGPTMRLGMEYLLSDRWSLRAEYTTFRLRTTATVVTQTPGVGAIPRSTDIKGYPRILGASLGYTF